MQGTLTYCTMQTKGESESEIGMGGRGRGGRGGEGEGTGVLDHAIVRSVLTFFVMSQVRFHLDILSEFRRYECTYMCVCATVPG